MHGVSSWSISAPLRLCAKKSLPECVKLPEGSAKEKQHKSGRPVPAQRFRQQDADGGNRDGRAPQKIADDWGKSISNP
jgi:hypothetical protein